MATWKKVLIEGQDLTDTTALSGNTGDLGVGTNGGITLNGAITDIGNVLLGTATVNLAININGLGSADIEDTTDLIAFYDSGTSLTKKTTTSKFAEMLAGTVATTGIRDIGNTLEVNTAAAAAIASPAGTEKILVWDGSAHKSVTIAQIAAEASDGDITSVVAGDGLTGGATSGDAALAVGAGSLIDVAADEISVDLTEAAAATIAAGDNVIFLDGGATGAASKGSVNDIAALFAGAGLTATDGVIAVDNVALGSGTSGNYASAVTAGNNISVSGVAGEGTSFAVALATNVDVAGTLGVNGVATFDSNVTVLGNLSVTGEVTSTSTTELLVEDKTILIASGASAAGSANSAGIVVDTSGLTTHGADAKLNYLESGATFSEWQMIKGQGATPKATTYLAGMAVGTSQSDLNTNYDAGLGSLGWDGTDLYIQTA